MMDVLDEVVNIYGFVSYRRDRHSSNFGGAAIYIKEGLSFDKITYLEHRDNDIIWMEMISKSPKVHLIYIYRPPTDDDSLLNYLGSKLNKLKINENVISVGDFNEKHSDWYTDGAPDGHVHALLNSADTNGLFQLVKDATRRGPTGKASQSDLVFTDIEDS